MPHVLPPHEWQPNNHSARQSKIGNRGRRSGISIIIYNMLYLVFICAVYCECGVLSFTLISSAGNWTGLIMNKMHVYPHFKHLLFRWDQPNPRRGQQADTAGASNVESNLSVEMSPADCLLDVSTTLLPPGRHFIVPWCKTNRCSKSSIFILHNPHFIWDSLTQMITPSRLPNCEGSFILTVPCTEVKGLTWLVVLLLLSPYNSRQRDWVKYYWYWMSMFKI